MKRNYFVAVTVLCSLLLSVSPAGAAVVPGSKCSKAGQTRVENGKRYTCIKLGKNLYWNNGVKIAKPTPTSSVAQPQGKLTISKWENDIPTSEGCGTLNLYFYNASDTPVLSASVLLDTWTDANTDAMAPYRGSDATSWVKYEMFLAPGETKMFSRFLCTTITRANIKYEWQKSASYKPRTLTWEWARK